ncbi:3-dehydroquinate synthase [Deinococcus sp. Marseille-Q6407]|uniref:3-dehydroquinate synthase n=1 Tax=Deinococcus sp. Marseille-Q6407 TaxID=2969223 RepID=UPI0021BF634B|nr:3-dehydroquinate synthase [Deinococcus sp. Marseille-Q6407]
MAPTNLPPLRVPWPGQDRSTAVEIGSGILAQASVPEPQVALLHDSALPDEWVQRARQALNPALVLPVTSGESGKTLQEVERLLSALAQGGLTRAGAVVGLGGGATTDVAGFVAASYLRGVSFYAAPTTLLGMVDAAIGGKTGVNLPEGKNLVGAFWPPRTVWCDTETLDTLPPRDFRSGAAEVFKHGLLARPELLTQVLPSAFSAAGLTRFSEWLPELVHSAAAVKAEVVARDPTEQGERAFLNLGHTLAHALEAYTRHKLPHGEAVGYGLHFAALLSEAQGASGLSGYTRAFLNWQSPEPLPRLQLDSLWPFIARDKKADELGVRWVLLRDIAETYLARLSREQVAGVFEQWRRDI